MRVFEGLVIVCSFYMVSTLLGLYTAEFILPLMYPPAGEEQIIAPVVSDPGSVWSSVEVLLYILVGTGLLLFLMRRGYGFVIRAALMVSFFSGTFFTFAAFIGDFALLPAAAVPILLWRRNSPFVGDIALLFTLPGVGAMLGASLGVAPSMILIVLASAYDWWAVFVTKHMVTLAKESVGRYAMMFLAPVGGRTMGLGAGDIALPLTFSVSVLGGHGMAHALSTAAGGLVGLAALIWYMMDKRDVTLPALPPITFGLLAGYGLGLLLFGF